MQPPPPQGAIRAELKKILASAAFRGSNRSGSLLEFIVEAALDGRAQYLKEYTLGSDALRRGQDFDPRIDPIVRVEVSRLRARLEQYYAKEGAADQVRISLPKGSYVPQFVALPEETPAAASPGPVLEQARASRWRDAAWLAGGGALAVGFAVWFSISTALQEPQRATGAPLRLDIAVGARGEIAAQVGNSIAVSPDGTVVAFVALMNDGNTRLFARRLDELEARELEGSSGAHSPFFSPDGRWIGFWAAGRIKKTLAAGGASPIALAAGTDFLGASWADDGSIVATLDRAGKLWRVPEDGGAPRELVAFEDAAELPRWPQVLPNGNAVIVTTTRASGPAVELVSLADGERRTLVQAGSYGRYWASGHLAYIDRGTLFAVPFDAARGEVRGTPARVLDDVAYDAPFGFAQLDVARNGTLVYLRSAAAGVSTIRWLDGANEQRALLDEPGRYQWPRLAPDGQRLAYVSLDGTDSDIWTLDLRTGMKTRLTGGGVQTSPLWTPDGKLVLYYDATQAAMLAQAADGTGTARPLVAGTASPWSFSPDGRRLAYQYWSDETSFDLYTLAIELASGELTAGEPEKFLATEAFENYPAFSPDGRWLAYCSNESGAWEVYVRAFPDDGRHVRVSTNGGCIPAWSHDGSRLYYKTLDHRMMSLRYSTDGGTFVPAAAEGWSTAQLADTGILPNFDVAPNAESLAALVPVGAAQPPRDHVTLVLGLFDALPVLRQ